MFFLTFELKRNQNVVHFSIPHQSFSGACNRSFRTGVPGAKMYLKNWRVKTSSSANPVSKDTKPMTSVWDLTSTQSFAKIRIPNPVRLLFIQQPNHYQSHVYSHKTLGSSKRSSHLSHWKLYKNWRTNIAVKQRSTLGIAVIIDCVTWYCVGQTEPNGMIMRSTCGGIYKQGHTVKER